MKALTDEQLKELRDRPFYPDEYDHEQFKQMCREILALRKMALMLIDHILEDEEPEEIEKKNRMFYVGGSKQSFRCEECGCNVFRNPVGKPDKYVCNACTASYTGVSHDKS